MGDEFASTIVANNATVEAAQLYQRRNMYSYKTRRARHNQIASELFPTAFHATKTHANSARVERRVGTSVGRTRKGFEKG